MEQQTYQTHALDTRAQVQTYHKILSTILSADPQTKEGKEAIRTATIQYINLVAAQNNTHCTFNFDPLPDFDNLSLEEKRKMIESGSSIMMGMSFKDPLHICFSECILNATTLAEWSFYVNAIAHEFSHIYIDLNPQKLYTNKNINGLTQEFISHDASLSTIVAHLQKQVGTEENNYKNFGDFQLAKTIARCIYFFDDNEVRARFTGLDAQRQVLADLTDIALSRGIAEEKHLLDSKEVCTNLILHEQKINRTQRDLLAENIVEFHRLMHRLTKEAIREKNDTLLLALADIQDIKHLYNPQIYKTIEKHALETQNPLLTASLHNSKYAKISYAQIKKDVLALTQSQETTPAQTVFANYESAEILSILDSAPAPVDIIAQSIPFSQDNLTPEGKQFVEKQLAKAPNYSPNTQQIIDAEAQPAKHKLGRQKLEKPAKKKHIITEEKPEKRHIISEEKPISPATLAQERASKVPLSPAAQTFVNKRQTPPSARPKAPLTKDGIILAEDTSASKTTSPQKAPLETTKDGIILATDTTPKTTTPRPAPVRPSAPVINAKEQPAATPLSPDAETHLKKLSSRTPAPPPRKSDTLEQGK